jgi:integrase
MPHRSDIEQRNRALVAFIAVTGARVTAVASMQLRHLDLETGRVMQDARQVRTKFSKSFPMFFFNIGGEALEIVAEWVGFLRDERGWGHDDPLFPATRIALDSEGKFESAGLDRQGWRNSTPIRTIFRDAFSLADLPYYNPHSFRKTLALLAGRTCRTPEQFKAWSQNLGHDDVLTTFRSYGSVSAERQAALIRDAKLPTEDETDFAELFAVVDRLKQKVPA